MSHIYLYFLILVSAIQLNSEPVPRILFLNDDLKFNYSQTDSPQQYYQLSMPSSTDGQILLISVIAQARNYIQIFIDFSLNETVIYPTSAKKQIACYDLSLDTCPIDLEKYKNYKTIYFTVVSRTKDDYQLSAFLSDIYQLDNSTSHTLNFSDITAGVFTITPSMFSLEEVDIILMYDEYFDSLEPFNIRAGLNQLPTSPITQLQGSSLGAFSRIIRFLNSTEQTQYFIVITAYEDALLDLTISVPKSELKNNSVYLGQVSTSQSQFQVTTYYYTKGFPQNIAQQIHIQATTLMGSGSVNIYYCQQLIPIYRYQNTNGVPAHFFISVEERKSCLQIMLEKGQGLLLQQLFVKFEQILPNLGYELNFYFSRKDLQDNRQLWIYDKQYGSFPDYLEDKAYLECEQYEISWEQSQTPLQLFYECDSCTFKFESCYFMNSSMKCDEKILPSTKDTYNWTTDKQINYISVCPNEILSNTTYFNTFSLGFKKSQTSIRTLSLNRGHHQIVDMNGIQYFYIEPNKNQSISENATFEIVVKTINGYIDLYTSLTEQYPNMKEMYTEGKKVDTWWSQQASYAVSQADKGIYIGVSGRAQSLYLIYSYIDQHLPTPQPQPQLLNITLQDNANTFELKKNQTALLFYKSHIIPYNISITPFPSCIQIYESQGQITNEKKCLDDMPTHTLYPYQQIVLRVSSSQNKTIAYTLDIIIPQISLKQFEYISIACISHCYTNITVQVPSNFDQLSVKHFGSGVLEQFESQTQNVSYSNEIFTVQCEQQGAGCKAVLNASLPFGGMMFIQNTMSDSNYVTWMTNTLKLDQYNPISLVYALDQFSQNNNLLLLSQSAPIDAYYTFFIINTSETNVINYQYDPPQQAPGSQKYENFKKFQVIRLGQKINCTGTQLYCLATVTLFPVLSVQPIPQNSLVSFSSNSYTYHLNLNYPYLMRSVFGLAKYQYRNAGIYYATIKPLSNCEAVISGLQSQFGQVSNDEGSVTFQVATLDSCVYMVTLSQCPYRNILSGIQYYFDMTQQGSQMTLYYIHRYERPLRIYASQQMTILVNAIQQDCQLPSGDFEYKKQADKSGPIFINSTQISAYAIVIKVDSEEEDKLAHIRIQVQDSNLVLLPNRPAPVMTPATFKYFTKQNIEICMRQLDSQQEQVSVQINMYQDSKTFFNSEVSIKKFEIQCININNISKEYIEQYIIEVKGQDILIQLQATQEPQSVQLFPSITYKDRIANLQQQCFRSQTIQGMDMLTFNIIFQYPLSKDQFVVFSEPPTQFQVIQLTQNSVQIKREPIQNNLWCIISQGNPQMDYYITLQGKGVKSIVQNQLKYTNSTTQNTYDIYQYISLNPNSILLSHPQKNDIRMTKLVNCMGSGAQLKGSTDYQQILHEKTTQIQRYWTNYDMIIGTFQAPPGYYYLGVQTQKTSLYSLKTILSTSLDVPSPQWKLSNTTITTSNSNQYNLVVSLPKLVTHQNTTQIYTVLIANSDIKMDYSLETLGKCPQLDSAAFQKIMVFQKQNPSMPVFQIASQDLPTNLTIFAYVSVPMSNALTNVSYYYHPTEFQVIIDDGSEGGAGILSWIIILAIIFLVLFVLRYLYIIWKRRKNRAQIEFEMSQSARQQQNNTNEQTRQSNRGYGQFVDQAQ